MQPGLLNSRGRGVVFNSHSLPCNPSFLPSPGRLAICKGCRPFGRLPEGVPCIRKGGLVVFGCACVLFFRLVVAFAHRGFHSTTCNRRRVLRQPHSGQPIQHGFRTEVLPLKGFWMLVDAAIFAVACAVLVSMPHALRPAQALESVALSTALEDIALAASSQPDLVALACEGASGEIALKEKLVPATRTFPESVFSIRCPGGKEVLLSESPAAASKSRNPSKPFKSFSTNRVIVSKEGKAMLAVFAAQSYGG